MFSKETEKTLENYIQVFIGALIIVYAAMKLFYEPSNGGYWLFLCVGTVAIFIAHWRYKKRRNGTKERK